MTAWMSGKALAVDTETSGTSVDSDRIVAACAAIVHDGHVEFRRDWLVKVDVEIPAEATAVHGVTTEHAREHGVPAAEAIPEIANAVRYAVHSGLPIVAYNAVFDLSILNAECVRNGLGTLTEFCDREIAPVIDPLCADKAVDRYRPGSRKLTDTCALYGVELTEAHTAAADALAAAEVARRIAERSRLSAEALRAMYCDRKYPDRLVRGWQALGRMTLDRLHAAQVQWYREQTESLARYWRGLAEEKRAEAARDEVTDGQREIALQEAAELDAKVDSLSPHWPIQPFQPEGTS